LILLVLAILPPYRRLVFGGFRYCQDISASPH
jgi:hypothetical protein